MGGGSIRRPTASNPSAAAVRNVQHVVVQTRGLAVKLGDQMVGREPAVALGEPLDADVNDRPEQLVSPDGRLLYKLDERHPLERGKHQGASIPINNSTF